MFFFFPLLNFICDFIVAVRPFVAPSLTQNETVVVVVVVFKCQSGASAQTTHLISQSHCSFPSSPSSQSYLSTHGRTRSGDATQFD